ncbi:hypothetical protein Cni_G22902 [Canna indica]|uniref:Uncharacterized protein n=1 Tax=Canna indica TaxID=4628 RepID=A0AAQ3KV18_9LILI|nr:hypothetical protein Cni_G22902 [Canna indica]
MCLNRAFHEEKRLPHSVQGGVDVLPATEAAMSGGSAAASASTRRRGKGGGGGSGREGRRGRRTHGGSCPPS